MVIVHICQEMQHHHIILIPHYDILGELDRLVFPGFQKVDQYLNVNGFAEFLFGKGDERRLYEKLGAQIREYDGVKGVSFAVWAPNAKHVSVVGDFNGWDGRYYPMRSLGASGIWELFIPGLNEGVRYKYEICDCHGALRLKADPMGFLFEVAPQTATIVYDLAGYSWGDKEWLENII